MTRDELRAHAAVEFAKVLLREVLKRNEATRQVQNGVVEIAVDLADQLAESLYLEGEK